MSGTYCAVERNCGRGEKARGLYSVQIHAKATSAAHRRHSNSGRSLDLLDAQRESFAIASRSITKAKTPSLAIRNTYGHHHPDHLADAVEIIAMREPLIGSKGNIWCGDPAGRNTR